MPRKKKPLYDILKDPKFKGAVKNLIENQNKPGPKGGRPSKYHPVLVQHLWDLLDDQKKVYTQAELCAEIGISETLARTWKKERPDFEEVARAHQMRLKAFFEKSLRLNAAKGAGNSRSIEFGLMNVGRDNYSIRRSDETIIDQRVTKVPADIKLDELSAEQKREMLAVLKKKGKDEKSKS